MHPETSVDQQSRLERLKTDRDRLVALAAASTIFRFEPVGESGDRYTLIFRGKGLTRDPAAPSAVTVSELHHIDLRMPFAYPESPPDIRWITPVWHPNVSFSGFVNTADIGLDWTMDMPIDVVCERLWDVARAAYVNPDRAANAACFRGKPDRA